MKKFVVSFLFALAVLVPLSSQAATTYVPTGCTSTSGFSATTGAKCDTLITGGNVLGCTTTTGLSPVTGGQCGGYVVAITTSTCYTFNNDLTLGSTGPDVVALQDIMISGGYLVMPATGESKGYFGTLTQAAVAKWQAANSISPASGYLGPVSRAALNTLYSCVQSVAVTPTGASISLVYGDPINMVAKLKATVTAKGKDIYFNSSSFSYSVTNNSNSKDSCFNGYECPGVFSQVVVSSGAQVVSQSGNFTTWKISDGQAATVELDVYGNTERMFGGVYSVTAGAFYYGLTADVVKTSQSISGLTTNSIAVVGETSPYITSVKQTDSTHFVIYGDRVNEGTIFIDNKSNPGVGTASARNFDGTFTTGSHALQIRGAKGGDSNQVYFDVVGTTTTQSIKVLAPNGGETLQVGVPYTIRWTSSGVTRVRLGWCTTGCGVLGAGLIADNLASSGSYTWTPTFANPSIKIEALGSLTASQYPAIDDWSDNFLKIISATTTGTTTSPKIDVQFPNGGETIVAGTPITIKWTKNFTSSKVTNIALVGQNGLPTQSIAASLPAGTSQYSWILPGDLLAGTYRVKVTICPETFPASYNCSDESDGVFQVISHLNETFAKITSPSLSIWRRGQNQTVTWTTRPNTNLNLVHLDLINQTTGAVKSLATDLSPAAGSYTFYLAKPGEAGVVSAGTYRIRITVCPKEYYASTAGENCTSESKNFTIGEPTNTAATSTVSLLQAASESQQASVLKAIEAVLFSR